MSDCLSISGYTLSLSLSLSVYLSVALSRCLYLYVEGNDSPFIGTAGKASTTVARGTNHPPRTDGATCHVLQCLLRWDAEGARCGRTNAFKRFKNLVKIEKEEKIKCLRTDSGGEFISEEFSKWCEDSIIQRQLTAPYTQQNRAVKRNKRTVMGLERSMLKEKSLPLPLWDEAVNMCTS